jgi:hypothetical protein
VSVSLVGIDRATHLDHLDHLDHLIMWRRRRDLDRPSPPRRDPRR